MSITFFAHTDSGKIVRSAVETFRFPGGEWHLRVPERETPAHATLRGSNSDDLVTLTLWADWVHSLGARAVAHIPYLPAARADRGVPFGARVYANLINAIELDEVVVFDPHSPVAPELINAVRVVSSAQVITERVLPGRDVVAILAPDAGAVPRATRVAELAGLSLLTARKSRDFATGKLSGFVAPAQLPPTGRVLVVDDICDGGGTFRGLAAALGLPRERLDLWVSHGIFSGAAAQLREHFGEIWTSDSHPGATRADMGAKVVELEPYLLAAATN